MFRQGKGKNCPPSRRPRSQHLSRQRAATAARRNARAGPQTKRLNARRQARRHTRGRERSIARANRASHPDNGVRLQERSLQPEHRSLSGIGIPAGCLHACEAAARSHQAARILHLRDGAL